MEKNELQQAGAVCGYRCCESYAVASAKEGSDETLTRDEVGFRSVYREVLEELRQRQRDDPMLEELRHVPKNDRMLRELGYREVGNAVPELKIRACIRGLEHLLTVRGGGFASMEPNARIEGASAESVLLTVKKLIMSL